MGIGIKKEPFCETYNTPDEINQDDSHVVWATLLAAKFIWFI